jgi:cytochrome c oxidase cbb3-type subunit III
MRANRTLPFAVPAAVLALATPAALEARADPRGEKIYQRECSGCHGPRGEGGRGPTLAVPKLSRAADRAALIDIIEDGIDGTEMPDTNLQMPQARLVAAWVLELGRRPAERVPGDAGRGQELYFGKAGCVLCHAIAGEGGALGPELTDIGARRGAAHLRSSMTEPEASLPTSSSPYRADALITQNFLQVRVVTRQGQETIGVRVNEDTFSIQIREAGNRVRSFWKSDLQQLHKEWGRSPMPSYAETLQPQELQDLVAFLASLRAAPLAPGSAPLQGGH